MYTNISCTASIIPNTMASRTSGSSTCTFTDITASNTVNFKSWLYFKKSGNHVPQNNNTIASLHNRYYYDYYSWYYIHFMGKKILGKWAKKHGYIQLSDHLNVSTPERSLCSYTGLTRRRREQKEYKSGTGRQGGLISKRISQSLEGEWKFLS